MSQYHLSKLDKGLAVYFSRMLEEITEKIECSLPATFSMTEQAEFALGYYHQNAEMSRAIPHKDCACIAQLVLPILRFAYWQYSIFRQIVQ